MTTSWEFIAADQQGAPRGNEVVPPPGALVTSRRSESGSQPSAGGFAMYQSATVSQLEKTPMRSRNGRERAVVGARWKGTS